jgi:hypothetical protein
MEGTLYIQDPSRGYRQRIRRTRIVSASLVRGCPNYADGLFYRLKIFTLVSPQVIFSSANNAYGPTHGQGKD